MLLTRASSRRQFRNLDRAVSSFDRPNSFTGAIQYRTSGPRWLRNIEIDPILTARDGLPTSITQNNLNSAGSAPPAERRSTTPACTSAVHMRTAPGFSTCCPSNAPDFPLGPVGPLFAGTGATRTLVLPAASVRWAKAVRTPGELDLDLAVSREFHLRESVRLRIRAEAFNILNHTNLLAPNVSLTATTNAAGQPIFNSPGLRPDHIGARCPFPAIGGAHRILNIFGFTLGFAPQCDRPDGRDARLEPPPRPTSRRRSEMILPDGRNLNQALVRAGLTWWHQPYARHEAVLAELEVESRAAHRGLWADKNPWEFRKPRATHTHQGYIPAIAVTHDGAFARYPAILEMTVGMFIEELLEDDTQSDFGPIPPMNSPALLAGVTYSLHNRSCLSYVHNFLRLWVTVQGDHVLLLAPGESGLPPR